MENPLPKRAAHEVTSRWMDTAYVQAVLWAAVCGYAVFATLAVFGAPVGEFDDAIPLVGGMLVGKGLIPNVDFHSVYPPLGLYVNAFAFHLLGRNAIAARTISAGLYLLTLILAARFLGRQFRGAGALVPMAMLLFAAAIGETASSAMWQGFALSLSGLLVYLRPANSRRSGLIAAAAAGVLIGISVLYRVNFGAYAAAAVCLDLSLRRKAPDFTALCAFSIPIAVVCSGFYLAVYGAGAAIVVPRLLETAGHTIGVRFIELGFSVRLVCALMAPALWFCVRILTGADRSARKALAAVACAIAVPALAMAGRTHSSIPHVVVLAELAAVILLHVFTLRLEPFELAILLFYCCVLHYYLARVDEPHWAVIPIAAALLLPALALQAVPRFAGLGILAAAMLVLLSSRIGPAAPELDRAIAGMYILAEAGQILGQSDTDVVVDEVAPPIPQWAALYSDRNELEAVRYLRVRSGSGDAIFVGAGDHSRVYLNDVRIYWLADRPIGVRTFELDTGVATEADTQREIISDLKRSQVKWVVLDLAPWRGDRTFHEKAYRGSGLLDEYIRDRFEQRARFGRYAVYGAR